MNPPKASVDGNNRPSTDTSPAVFVCLVVLKNRREFLLAAKAKRCAMPGLVLQARCRTGAEPIEGIRVGFTCSKKVGNAVARNRAKRRLRHVAQDVLPHIGLSGWDYVLIGRAKITDERLYTDLQGDLRRALAKIHGVSA